MDVNPLAGLNVPAVPREAESVFRDGRGVGVRDLVRAGFPFVVAVVCLNCQRFLPQTFLGCGRLAYIFQKSFYQKVFQIQEFPTSKMKNFPKKSEIFLMIQKLSPQGPLEGMAENS